MAQPDLAWLSIAPDGIAARLAWLGLPAYRLVPVILAIDPADPRRRKVLING